MLQCATVCYSVLKCAAVCYSVLTVLTVAVLTMQEDRLDIRHGSCPRNSDKRHCVGEGGVLPDTSLYGVYDGACMKTVLLKIDSFNSR
jgi:hypothetical protein